MDKKKILRVITYSCLFVMLLGLLMGCGGAPGADDTGLYFHSSLKQDDTQTTESAAEEIPVEGQELYLIAENNQVEESLRLYRYANGMEYRYYYGTGTRFYDKYGSRTTVMKFQVGSVVTIGDVDSEGILREARLSAQVWEYDNISRFSIDEDRHIFQIADTKYTYNDITTYIFSNEERVMIGNVKQGDTLSAVGMGKEILSLRITTGQGTLELKNTELFEGSYLQLGTRIFAEITPDMQLSVEEGTYDLIVANKGWGGSREVIIARGETTVVDLDELKGEGPKVGRIQFVIDVADAVLMIDGEQLDYKKPLEITYGEHSLAVYANGYDAWVRNLYVNSKEATIVIQLKDEKTDSEPVKTDSDKGGSTSQSGSDQKNTESTQSTNSSSQSGSSGNKTESERRQDELDLIKDLLTSTVL